MEPTISLANSILGAVATQEKNKAQGNHRTLLDQVVKEIGKENDSGDVDILTYVRAEWGLNENPYPIQRFILKVINGLPLDDRPDSEVLEVIDDQTLKVYRAEQFDNESLLDIGENTALRVEFVDYANNELTLCSPPPTPIKVGDSITGRIITWDRFREKITGAYTETEFFNFLYAQGPGDDHCRINLSLEEYKERVMSKRPMNLIILRIGRRGTKCLNKNTLCFTNWGLLSLEELKGQSDFQVPNGKGQLKRVSLVYDNGIASTLKIKTSLGNMVEGTPEHKLWVMNSSGDLEWRKLADLKIGDTITLSRRNEGVFGQLASLPLRQFEYWGEWLGTKTEPSSKEYIPAVERVSNWTLSSTSLPLLIRTAGKKQVARFLRGWFKTAGIFTDCKINLKIDKEEVAKQVQLLLLMFGIRSKLTPSRAKNTSWWISIRGNYDRTLFSKEIELPISKKSCQQKDLGDVIPHQTTKLKQYRKQLVSYGMSESDLQYFPDERQPLTRTTLIELLRTYKAPVPLRAHFEHLVDCHYIYTKVKTIEAAEAETLDLSVPDGRTYVASGCVTHNTTISQWMAAYFAYKVLRKYYPQQYYRTRRDQAISMTLIATGKEQAQDLLAPARSAMKRSPYLRRFVAADSERRLTLNTPYNIEHGLDAENGLKIIAAPCSAKSVRGPANILVLMEEYGMFYYELVGSNKSDRAIYDAISPSLADLKDPVTGGPAGTMMIISTPLTRESHMYELEQMVWEKHPDLKDSLILHLPSYWTNKLLSTEKLRADYAVNPVGFHQEYEAYYSDQRQAALAKEELEGCCEIPKPDSLFPRMGESCFMGFDLGLKNDPTSTSIVAVNHKGHARLVFHEVLSVEQNPEYVDEEVGDVLDIMKIASRIDFLWREWGCRRGMGDQWNAPGFRPLLRTDAKVNLEFLDISSSLNDRIAKNFLAYIYQRNLTIYCDKEAWEDKLSLVRELIRLQRLETSGMVKRIKLEAPNLKGAHDDQYSSLSRALYCAQQEILERPPVVLTTKNPSSKVKNVITRVETLRRQRQHAKDSGRPSGKGKPTGRFRR
jgi:hypothetical protein